MKPILYESNATNFFNLGLGVLSGCKDVKVTEGANAEFYLEMKYPMDSPELSKLKNNRLIKADAGHELKAQLFEIKKISKPIKGFVEVYAEHVSYKARDIPLRPNITVNGTAEKALQQWQNNFVGSYKPFTVTSNITTSHTTSWNIREVKNAREALGGVEGSILDTWGGEYKFDNYHISLWRERGRRANAMIAYGRNLKDFEQEESILNTYTSIYPYASWADNDGKDHLITADGFVIDSEHVNKYPNKKVLPVDFTTEFERDEKPTSAKLTQLAKAYIINNDVGIPSVSIRLTHLDLSQTLDHSEYKGVEEINLFDSVMVKFQKISVDVLAKVVRVVWNVLLERYDEIEIGNVRASLSDRLNTIDQKVNEAKKNSDDALNVSVIAANGINTVFYGPDEPIAKKVGDTWYQEDGTHTILKIWNGVIWFRIIGTDDVDFLKDEMEENNRLVEEAKEAAADALIAGEEAKVAGEDARKAADDAQVVGNQAKIAGEEAKVAAANAQKAGENAEQLATVAQAEAIEARKRSDQSVNQINQAVSNAGFTSLDALTNDLRTKTSQAQTNASNAIEEAKLLTSEIAGVKGSVSNIGVQIDSINGTLDLKASTAEINRIDGTLTTVNNQLNYQAGQLSSKISETQLQDAIDGTELSGRNLLLNSTFKEGLSKWRDLDSNHYNILEPEVDKPYSKILHVKMTRTYAAPMHNDVRVKVEPGEKFIFSSDVYVNTNQSDFTLFSARTFSSVNESGNGSSGVSIIKGGSGNSIILSELIRMGITSNKWFRIKVILESRISGYMTIGPYLHRDTNEFKIRESSLARGNKSSGDWSPAPEDIDSKINHVESEWKQTANEISGTISNVSGEISVQKQTLNSFTQSLMDPNTGRLVKAEQNLNGLQNTVKDKANQTEVTTLANGFNVLSRQSVTNLVPVNEEGDADHRVWSRGSQVSFASGNGIGFVVTQNINNSNMTGDNRIYLPPTTTNMSEGKNYTIIVEINADGNAEVGFGQTSGNNIKRSLSTGSVERFTLTYEANSTNSFSIFFLTARSYRIRFVSVVEGGGASQGQLSVLNDAINLRVTKGEVVNQISVTTEGILLDGAKTHITGKTTIDSAVIKTAHIDNLAVNNAKIANAAISTAKIGNAQITNALIQNLAVDGAKIANAAITNAKIGNLAVDSAKIADLAVSTAKIANAAINSAKIGTAAIGTAHIGDGAITNAKIGNASITATKIQDATITAAKIIDLNVTDATAGTITGPSSDWNLKTGRMEFKNLSTGNTLVFTQGDITFQRGTQERKLEYSSEGLILTPGPNNTGTGLNASIQIVGGGASSAKYIQFYDPGPDSSQRIQATTNHMDLMPGNGGRVRVMTFGGGGSYASIEALMFYTNHPSGKSIRYIENRIETPRDGDREIIISPQGNAGVRVRNAAGGYYPVYAANFVNSSSRKLKTNIIDYNGNALGVINSLKVVQYNLISDLENGVHHRQIGLIAEDSPSVSSADGTGIENYKAISHLIKAVQELDKKENRLESKVTSLEMYVKGNLEIELNKAKVKIQELEYKLKQMEEVA